MNGDPSLPLQSLADVERFERIPLEARATEWTVQEVVERGAAIDPQATAFDFLADAHPDETPYTVTFGDLVDASRRTANLLHRLSGDRPIVGTLLPLVPEAYYLLCGAPSTGILTPVNWSLKPPQIAAILDNAEAEVLVTLGPTPGFNIWETTQDVLPLLPKVRHLIQIRGPGGELGTVSDALAERIAVHDFSSLFADERGDRLDFERTIDPDETAIYCPTGGTTGTPKLAKLSHRGIAYKCHAFAWMLGHGPGDVLFAGLPLFHSGGMVPRTLSPLSCGITSVVLSPHGFRAPNSRTYFWKLVERYRVTELVAPPTVLAGLIGRPLDADISTLKPYANTGSAGLPAATARAFEKEFGIQVMANYGLTENTASAALSPRTGQPRYGASGIRIPYTRIKTVIVDAAGRKVRDGEPGEHGVLAISGPGVSAGYVEERLNDGLFFPDGYLNTGDLGRIDDEGYVWVTGRTKDLIIRGGHNIDASLIDDTLLAHDAVELAAAVGKPDAYAGELPIVFVQLKPGHAVSDTELQAFARENIPERGAAPVEVHVLDRLPLTEVGKIFKPPLRRVAAENALRAALAELPDCSVSVIDEPGRGMVARVAMGDADNADRREAVAAALGKFTLAYEIVEP